MTGLTSSAATHRHSCRSGELMLRKHSRREQMVDLPRFSGIAKSNCECPFWAASGLMRLQQLGCGKKSAKGSKQLFAALGLNDCYAD
ncbi:MULTISPECIES: hypothetical protein [unclassified Ruegeria]|uniref:hypothetical protein n=1 Tax=unclassified Ruegeria TaxID=2625375 RepID=UPI0014885694|nr:MULTISPECIES: hypothetical protein [unclassified Ruegeria]